MTARPSIFVNIASYRDPECQWTLADLFAKARHPERVFVGICWQFVPEQDQHCFLVRPRPEQVRVVEVHADHGRGTCWARAQAYQLWRGEDYVLQIDAHSRFVADWDEVLLATLAECPSPRPILSAFLSGYDPSYTDPRGRSAFLSANYSFK